MTPCLDPLEHPYTVLSPHHLRRSVANLATTALHREAARTHRLGVSVERPPRLTSISGDRFVLFLFCFSFRGAAFGFAAGRAPLRKVTRPQQVVVYHSMCLSFMQRKQRKKIEKKGHAATREGLLALGALGVQSVTSHPGPGSSEAHPAGRMIGIGLRAREP